MKYSAYFTYFLIVASLSIPKTSANEKPLKVVFLGESSSNDHVWLYRVHAMKKAAQKLGIDFSFDFAQGDYHHHAQMIEEAINNQVDAIIGPWWHSTVYNTAITKAIEQGIFVYGLLGMQPRHSLSSDMVEHLGWTEIDWHDFGQELAKITYDALPTAHSILWPAETSMGNYIIEAIEGFKEYYNEQKIPISIDMIEIGFDTQKAVAILSDYLTTHTVSAIVTSGAIAIDAAMKAVKQLEFLPEHVKLFGQVVTPSTLQGIFEGYIPAGVNIEMLNSSYYALLDVLAAVKLGATPRRSCVGFMEITKETLTS